jgi:hypothetical protein
MQINVRIDVHHKIAVYPIRTFNVLIITKKIARIMKAFETSIENVVYRFGLMMAIIIITIAARVPVLALLAVPVFLSAMLAVKFKSDKKAIKETEVKNIPLRQDAA